MHQELGITEILEKNGYEPRAIIGKGGFSICYKVFSKHYNQFFVCKVISLAGQMKEYGKKSFDNEMESLCNIINPNIIKVYKTFSTSEYLFIVLEYCQDGDLHKYVLKNGPIKDQVKLLKYTGQILDALIYLEDNNIVHKDIKPSNILIDSFGTIKLADFGLSAFYDKNKLSEDYSGSTAFLAPEIVSKKPHNPVKSDIWSLGVSLYFIAVGNFPFPSDDHDILVKAIKAGKYIIPPNINKAIRIIITHSLLMNPDERMTFYQMKNIISNELKKLTEESGKRSKIGQIKSAYNIIPILPKSKLGHLKSMSRIKVHSSFNVDDFCIE